MKQPQITLYGIPNCDTVKKARAWLSERSLEYVFHDFKKQGISLEQLRVWCETLGVDQVLNRKGTTWRALTPTQQETASNFESALRLMQEHTSLIKRPVVAWSSGEASTLTVGFSPVTWMQHCDS